jgi:hypothetical protein
MLRILLTIVATLSVVFASWCIDGMWMQQFLLFASGFMMAGILMMSNEEERK